jgi:hypothetical protein
VGGAEFLARVDSSALAAQPFSVDEVRARDLWAKLRAAQPFECLAIELLGGRAVS